MYNNNENQKISMVYKLMKERKKLQYAAFCLNNNNNQSFSIQKIKIHILSYTEYINI